MHVLENKNQCAGCHACYAACPQHCITMQEDSEGFLQPDIDMYLCLRCGLCKSVCPILHPQAGQRGQAYACQNLDASVRMRSSSGGVFSLMAECVLEQGGVVFGAAFDEKFGVQHVAIESKEQLHKLCGSKYVQSRIGDCYTQAKAALEQGRRVLFTGTPCQIYGFKAFLKKDYENLYTQDIICHGVPAQLAWRAYVQSRERAAKSKVNRVSFRDKISGWKNFSMSVQFENEEIYTKLLHQDSYMKGFLGNLFLRKSCYSCAFKTKERVSDITLADFWGVDKICAKMDDDKGTSLVLVNSERGRQLFNAIQCKMKSCCVEMEAALQYNVAATQSVAEPRRREQFFELLRKVDFETAVNKCIPKCRLRKCLGKIKRFLKRMCKHV